MTDSFSLKERLFLSNQYDILAKLSNDDYEKKQYENMSEILRRGYSWGYGLVTEPYLEEVTGRECRFVLDVLNMYSKLYFSRENRKSAKDSIEEQNVLFKGFDLNDQQESKYYSFYRFLVEDLGRFAEFREWIDEGKIEDFNSHGFGPSIEKLERMIQKFKEFNDTRQDKDDIYFTEEEIKEILNA